MMVRLENFIWEAYKFFVYIGLTLSVDGTKEYAVGIRWGNMIGKLSDKRYRELDLKNYKKWHRKTKGDHASYREYVFHEFH